MEPSAKLSLRNRRYCGSVKNLSVISERSLASRQDQLRNRLGSNAAAAIPDPWLLPLESGNNSSELNSGNNTPVHGGVLMMALLESSLG